MSGGVSEAGRRVAGPEGRWAALRGGTALDELDARHRRVVTGPRSELQDSGVATGTIHVARADLGKELVGHVLAPDERNDLAVLMDPALAGRGDALLGHRSHRLGLGLGRDQGL